MAVPVYDFGDDGVLRLNCDGLDLGPMQVFGMWLESDHEGAEVTVRVEATHPSDPRRHVVTARVSQDVAEAFQRWFFRCPRCDRSDRDG